jgi:glycosyltransferase involved in cell wall biosynthesis
MRRRRERINAPAQSTGAPFSMKILIANHRYFIASGAERYLFNVAPRLRALGHEVAPFALRNADNLPSPYTDYFASPVGRHDQTYFDEYAGSPVALAKSFSRLFYSREVERRVHRLCADLRPDIAYVLLFQRKLSPSLLVGLKRAGVPIVARLSDFGMFCAENHCVRNNAPCTLCIDGDIFHSVRHKCVRNSYVISAIHALATAFHRARGYLDLIDVMVTTNPFMTEMMLRAGVPERRLRCIPTFADLDVFKPAATPASSGYLLFHGRLDPTKGLPVLLAAVAQLPKDAPPLLIAGAGQDPDYADELRARAAALKLGDRVNFLGYVPPDKVPELIIGARITIQPSAWFENMPHSVIESLACGVPVITSEIGTISCQLQDGVDSLLFKTGDATDLAEKVSRLCADDALHARLSLGARAGAVARHAPEAHVQALITLFDELRRS